MLPYSHDLIKILSIESNEANADYLAASPNFGGKKFEITTAKSLGESLALIKAQRFDVIVMDLSAPECQGVETLHSLTKDFGDPVIIALTDGNDEDIVAGAIRAGAEDCFIKGQLDRDQLARSIRHAVERVEMQNLLAQQKKEAQSHTALLDAIFDTNTDPMLILDTDYVIKHFNASAASLLDESGSGLVGQTFPFEVNPSVSTELEIPESSESLRLVEINAASLNWKGESALLVQLRDITRRRAAESALRREKERLGITLDSIVDAVIATDASGKIEQINLAATRLAGIRTEEAMGRPLGEIVSLKDPETGKNIDILGAQLLAPRPKVALSNLGFELERKDRDSSLTVIAETRSIPDEEGNNHGYVTVLRDISKEKKAGEELFQTEKFNSISLLAGGIAHDFNNMLTAILGNISVLRMDVSPDDPKSEKLLAAETAALQARSLTQQLLAFSKGGAPVLEVTTIGEFVEQSAQFVLRGSNVKCVVEQDKDLWPVDADKGQISQVVNNLLINADQAMPDGGTIQLRINNAQVRHGEIPALKTGDYVCIEVADQGCGIAPENLHHVFDPYFTTKEQGSGLGLASSYSIINSHGGAMTVHSTLGEGSTFRVFLPKTKSKLPPTELEQQVKEEKSEGIHQGQGRILVMDDMEAMMLVAGEILKVLGYEVEFSTNGEEAIEAYKKAKESGNPFDAVVFDLTVPGGMGGVEASEILIEYDPDLIAIASSGYTTSSVMSHPEKSAFKAVVPKPYRIKEMSDALQQVLKITP
jgi:PAS domain S-box-containing protein